MGQRRRLLSLTHHGTSPRARTTLQRLRIRWTQESGIVANRSRSSVRERFCSGPMPYGRFGPSPQPARPVMTAAKAELIEKSPGDPGPSPVKQFSQLSLGVKRFLAC